MIMNATMVSDLGPKPTTTFLPNANGKSENLSVLIAEDDVFTRAALERFVEQWGYSVVSTHDGQQALSLLLSDDAPSIAILDWIMPGLDGLTVCKRVREAPRWPQPYLIMMTVRYASHDVAEGLETGANDYMVKPFNDRELRARLRVGERVIRLQTEMARHIRSLETSVSRMKYLDGLLPICSHCKKIRDDHDAWESVDAYLHKHGSLNFTHTICPDCFDLVLREMQRGN